MFFFQILIQIVGGSVCVVIWQEVVLFIIDYQIEYIIGCVLLVGIDVVVGQIVELLCQVCVVGVLVIYIVYYSKLGSVMFDL